LHLACGAVVEEHGGGESGDACGGPPEGPEAVACGGCGHGGSLLFQVVRDLPRGGEGGAAARLRGCGWVPRAGTHPRLQKPAMKLLTTRSSAAASSSLTAWMLT